MRARLTVAALLLCSTLSLPSVIGASGLTVSAASAAIPAASPAIAAASPAKAAGPAKVRAAVKADWVKFFSAKTRPAKRIKLLQDGKEFTAVIRAASKNPLASAVQAKVTKVTLTSKTQANVTYSVVAAGQAVLKNQKGTAVLEGGTWKVGVKSFCGLLILENGGKKGLPKACG